MLPRSVHWNSHADSAMSALTWVTYRQSLSGSGFRIVLSTTSGSGFQPAANTGFDTGLDFTDPNNSNYIPLITGRI
jgi:hypothetical protein